MHPYQTLQVTLDDDSVTIRKAYVDAIRRHPPESDPESFRLINDAYQLINSEDARLTREIGSASSSSTIPGSPIEAALAFFKSNIDPKPLAESDFYAFLRS